MRPIAKASRQTAPTGRRPPDDALLSDEEVIARVMAGEAALYEILMRRNNRRLYRAVRAVLHDESEVEDVLQETYLAAYDNLAGFAGRARFSTWLVRIAVNKAIDRLRRSGRVLPLDTPDPAPHQGRPGMQVLASRGTDPERESASLEAAALLGRAIDALPLRYRTVYMLREVEELDTREVAESLAIPEATVKTRLHRARSMLRDALERDLGGVARQTFPFGGPRCDALVAAVLPRLG
jgi:RNA polymerase sigma-70 factor (ECF subfamily)